MNFGRFISLITTVLVLILAITVVLFGSILVYHAKPDFFRPKDSTSWQPPSIDKDLPEGREGKVIKYGYFLTSETAKWIGPQAKNKNMRFAGNNLACKNCHLDVGTRPGSASWVGVVDRFPQFRNRENKIGTIEERINGCMERSMNGTKLPEDSDEMQAIVAYMDWLGQDMPESRMKEFKGFPKLQIPKERADTIRGKEIYISECQLCHGKSGEGISLADGSKGYQYPPLWGNDSYNHGAGMNRVITAAQFIKGNMPYGQATFDNPKLTDEEAYHVAAYINSFKRPFKSNTEADFPDKKLKPVSTPYGPFADDFSLEQHKYGPFQPIISYYENEFNITKSK